MSQKYYSTSHPPPYVDRKITDAFDGFVVANHKSLTYFDSNCKKLLSFDILYPRKIKHIYHFKKSDLLLVSFEDNKIHFYDKNGIEMTDIAKPSLLFKKDKTDELTIHDGRIAIFLKYHKNTIKYGRLKLFSSDNIIVLTHKNQIFVCDNSYGISSKFSILGLSYTKATSSWQLENILSLDFKIFMTSMAISNNDIVYFSSFNSIYSFNFKTQSLVPFKSKPSSMITSIHSLTNEVLLVMTDNSEFLKFSTNPMVKNYTSFPFSPLCSILIDDIFITNSFILFYSSSTTIGVIDKFTQTLKGHIYKNKLLPINPNSISLMYSNLSFAFSIDNTHSIVSYTDGLNSVLTYYKSLNVSEIENIKSADYLVGQSNKNNTLMFKNDFPPFIRSCTDYYAIFPNHIDFLRFRKDKVECRTFFEIDTSCWAVNGNFAVVYNKKYDTVYILDGVKLNILPMNLRFKPSSISILKHTDHDFLLIFYSLTYIDVQNYNRENEDLEPRYSNMFWYIDEQIVNIEMLDSTTLCIYTLAGNIWRKDLNNLSSKPLLISENCYFSSMFSLAGSLFCIPKSRDQVLEINDKTKSCTKLTDLKGLFLNHFKKDNDEILISTTEGVFSFEPALQNLYLDDRIQLLGIVSGYLPYDKSTTLVYTNCALYLINNSDLKILTSMLLSSIFDVKFDKFLQSVIITTFDVNDKSLFLQFKFKKNENDETTIKIERYQVYTDSHYPMSIDPIDGKLFVGMKCLDYRNGFYASSFPYVVARDLFLVRSEYYVFITVSGNLMCTNKFGEELCSITGVDKLIVNHDNNIIFHRYDFLYYLDLSADEKPYDEWFEIPLNINVYWINPSMASWNETTEMVDQIAGTCILGKCSDNARPLKKIDLFDSTL